MACKNGNFSSGFGGDKLPPSSYPKDPKLTGLPSSAFPMLLIAVSRDMSLVELDNGVALAGEDGFGDDLLDERDSDEIGLSRRRNLVCKILLFPTILEESPGPNPFWRWPF